jgi:hypothetical protein
MIWHKFAKFTGREIPINPTVNSLYPTVTIHGYGSVEANFGDDLAKPFSYDIDKCPGLNLECNLDKKSTLGI